MSTLFMTWSFKQKKNRVLFDTLNFTNSTLTNNIQRNFNNLCLFCVIWTQNWKNNCHLKTFLTSSNFVPSLSTCSMPIGRCHRFPRQIFFITYRDYHSWSLFIPTISSYQKDKNLKFLNFGTTVFFKIHSFSFLI